MRAFLIRLILIGICLGLSLSARASVRSLQGLTASEQLSLQQSEERIALYDHALQSLDIQWRHRKLARQDYLWRQHDLVAFIGAEARYQNDLLTQDCSLPEDAAEVMKNVAKYSVEGLGYLACIALKASVGHSFTFSP